MCWFRRQDGEHLCSILDSDSVQVGLRGTVSPAVVPAYYFLQSLGGCVSPADVSVFTAVDRHSVGMLNPALD